MDTKLAIIIPTYNSLETLKVLVQNIFDHTTGSFHVFVVEDGQQRETIAWLKRVKNENFTVIYHTENKGIAKSWNDGLREALKGDFTHFAILNDDIELTEGWWEVCKRFKAHLMGLDAPCPIPLTGWFFVLDRYCIDTVGLFDEDFSPFTGEDAEYYYRCKEQGIKLCRIPLDVFHHSSTTIKQLDKKYVDRIFAENWQKLRAKYPKIRLQS